MRLLSSRDHGDRIRAVGLRPVERTVPVQTARDRNKLRSVRSRTFQYSQRGCKPRKILNAGRERTYNVLLSRAVNPAGVILLAL